MHNALDPNLPFGGMKMSGLGREHGEEGVLGRTESKTAMVRYSAAAPRPTGDLR